MSSTKKSAKLATKALLWVQKWLSRKSPVQAEKTGEKLGRLAFRLSKKHRERALVNLRLAFPEKTEAEREVIARGVLEHFGRSMVDFARSKSRTAEEVLATAEISGEEHLREALTKGKGVILVTAHFGIWERMAHIVSVLGFPTTVVARDANDPELQAMVNDLRESSGVRVISRGDAARPILSALKKNELVGLLPDQNSEEIFVPFFGHPCGTVMGPAIMSLRSGAPIIPVYGIRVGPNRYKVWAEPPLQPEEGFEPAEGLTRALNLSLENAIRRAPEQYLWIHNRWKSARKRGLVP